MAKLAPLFRLGLGGRLGHGRQWMPWIGRRDLVGLILHCLATDGPAGILNAVNPEPVTNREFTRVVAAAARRPAVMPAPAWALRLAYGQMAEETLLDSRRVVPTATLRSGFRFSESLAEAVSASLR
jgi:NAD dependent epimerase/dehydratase family enzyme